MNVTPDKLKLKLLDLICAIEINYNFHDDDLEVTWENVLMLTEQVKRYLTAYVNQGE